jgi:GH24 family phage-related lysozyme (muramidase)
MKLSRQGEEFIASEETGGKSYYENVYKCTFTWPKGASGPTAMVGIDIGYYTEKEIDDIFKPLTTAEELKLIQGGRGLKGARAEAYTEKLKKITFTWDEALDTFEKHTLPKFTKLTQRVFPGVEDLCDGARAVLVSLVFNRGTSLSGESRKEMLAIKNLVPAKDYKTIAAQIRSMKRLWPKGSGLLGRRDREAALVETCLS